MPSDLRLISCLSISTPLSLYLSLSLFRYTPSLATVLKTMPQTVICTNQCEKFLLLREKENFNCASRSPKRKRNSNKNNNTIARKNALKFLAIFYFLSFRFGHTPYPLSLASPHLLLLFSVRPKNMRRKTCAIKSFCQLI